MTVSSPSSTQTKHEFGYFDSLMARASNNNDDLLTVEPVYGGKNNTSHVGRNLYEISPKNGGAAAAAEEGTTTVDFGQHPSLLICHTPTMLRYSSTSTTTNKSDFSGGSQASGDVVGGGDLGAIAYAASAGILLALHHANNGNGIVAPELSGLDTWCPVRFTTEMLDKGGTGLDAVTSLAELVTRSPKPQSSTTATTTILQQQQQQPCSIIGAHVSDASSKLASLAAVFDIPVVSSSAMSTTLNDRKQYPTFLRTHTDVGGFGLMSVSFLKNRLGIHKFGLLFTNDGYGYGFSRSVLEAASEYDDVEVVGGGVPYIGMSSSSSDKDDDELRAAMKILVDSGCNYFVGNFYAESFAKVMTIATEYGLIGEGKFWLISGTADIAPFILGGALKVNQVVGKAIEGNGMYFCEGGVPGLNGTYDTFTREWNALTKDEQALAYINSKQPVKEDGTQYVYSPEFFQMRPHHVVTFSYDAGVGLALSACKAWKDATTAASASAGVERDLGTTGAFNGSAHYAAFANSTYIGASGHIKFRETFPTRTAESSYFVMSNLRAVPVDDNSTLVHFKGSPIIDYYDTLTSKWQQLPGKALVYSGGSSVPPLEMVPLDQNLSAGGIIAIVLAVVLAAVISASMLLRRRIKQNEISWEINPVELQFDDPPVVIGRGTFGLVLLAEYRGTTVAVKRVLPPRSVAQEKRRHSSFGRRSSASLSDSEMFDSLEEGLSSGEGVRANNRQRVSFHGDALKNVPEADEWVENKSGGDNAKKIIFSDFNPGVLSGTCLTGTGSGNSVTVTATKRRSTLTLKSVGIGNFGDDGYENLKRQFMKEMRLLSTLRHPNICTVMGEVTLGNDPMLIMEYMQMGSLFSLLHNETVPLSGELILPILQDVAKGVRFLHSSSPPVVHSDLKSANILVDSRFRAKVTDFGLSQKKKIGAAGTPYWMAPELLRKESDNTTASDAYSFGIILFEAYTRKVPYDGEDYDDVIKLVADKEVQKRPPLPEKAPPQIQSIMTECFADNPNERPIFDELDVRLQRLTVESADVTDTIRSHRKADPFSSQLLYDNFPKKVAEVLQEGRKVEPESRECVSIFFSDIVGFTDISSRLSPMKVSDMLDRLYHRFDELSRAHDVFKIETIGDAYMAVTNLVKDQDDHVKRLVDFAVEALAAANETLIDVDDKSRGCVNIRVGLHSGPVVASVVGSRNLKYSIFGDTVNVAARMEQNSRVNRIHMSESTAKILRLQDPSRSITPRGTINVKGKDLSMETFWINEKSTSGEKDEYNYLPRRNVGTERREIDD